MIRRDITVLALVLSATTWAANAPDAKTVLADASKALGADGLKSVEFSGSGFDYTLGQNPTPSSPWPKFNDKTYARYINFDNPESRMSRIRTQFENPPRGGGQQPIVGEQQQNQGINDHWCANHPNSKRVRSSRADMPVRILESIDQWLDDGRIIKALQHPRGPIPDVHHGVVEFLKE